MKSYTTAQKAAICHKNGPLMVIAGPGSGKTFVIVNRINFLIEDLKINPKNILVVTFTKAAAVEMKERFENEFDYKGVNFATFHSFFLYILKKAYGYKNEDVLDEKDSTELIKRAVDKFKIRQDDTKDIVSLIRAEISDIKRNRVNINDYYSSSCPYDIFRELYTYYEEFKKRNNKIDFEDMSGMTYELLKKREDIAKSLGVNYKYILIDEFQDINLIQYDIIKMIVKYHNNISIVGDDDQSIYGFRGARPDIMLGFEKEFPSCKKVVLDINFRSGKNIVEISKRLIANNKKRFLKEIKAHKDGGNMVRILTSDNRYKECLYIMDDINSKISDDKSLSYNDFAILYRTNVMANLFVTKLIDYDLPFKIRDGIFCIYDHFIFRDIMSYLRLAYFGYNVSDMLRIANRPLRYLKNDAVRNSGSFNELLYYYKDVEYMQKKVKELIVCLERIRENDFSHALAIIRYGINYDKYLLDFAQENDINDNELIDIIEDIDVGVKKCKNLDELNLYVREFKDSIKSNRYDDKPGIRLMTFHGSKGLEFKHVYVVSVNEGITPYKKAKDETDIEEERRMFYVALTRAKEELLISYIKDENNKNKDRLKPSIFVAELTGENNV